MYMSLRPRIAPTPPELLTGPGRWGIPMGHSYLRLARHRPRSAGLLYLPARYSPAPPKWPRISRTSRPPIEVFFGKISIDCRQRGGVRGWVGGRFRPIATISLTTRDILTALLFGIALTKPAAPPITREPLSSYLDIAGMRPGEKSIETGLRLFNIYPMYRLLSLGAGIAV